MAGRPLKPIPASAPRARRALVQRLRSLKKSSGMSCEVLAEKCGFSDGVVRRALAGGHVPLWETVEASVRRTWCARVRSAGPSRDGAGPERGVWRGLSRPAPG
ncbi:helix-turn-helix domain-containing protein [Streptomyces tendae]|uniref:helix-turn-helix domain-containing protein n=1 Tax=Streptomyces tendae TaxID=1932 RepID=UPI003EC0A77D